MALIKIVRDSGFYDRFRAYEIVLDGEIVGTIRDGETWEFSIANGQHYLSLKVDWCGSKTSVQGHRGSCADV